MKQGGRVLVARPAVSIAAGMIAVSPLTLESRTESASMLRILSAEQAHDAAPLSAEDREIFPPSKTQAGPPPGPAWVSLRRIVRGCPRRIGAPLGMHSNYREEGALHPSPELG